MVEKPDQEVKEKKGEKKENKITAEGASKETKKVEKSKEEKKIEKKEELPADAKVFTIPLRKAFRKSRKKRVPYAVRLIKEFVKRHMKVKNDEEIKIGKHLNEKLWERGIEKPPRRVRVNVTRVEKEIRVELFGFTYEEFKPAKAEEKGFAEKLAARLGPKALRKAEEEKRISGKEEKKVKEEKTEEKKKSKKEASSAKGKTDKVKKADSDTKKESVENG